MLSLSFKSSEAFPNTSTEVKTFVENKLVYKEVIYRYIDILYVYIYIYYVYIIYIYISCGKGWEILTHCIDREVLILI